MPSGVEALEHNHQEFVLLSFALPSRAGANHAWRAAPATLLSCFMVVRYRKGIQNKMFATIHVLVQGPYL